MPSYAAATDAPLPTEHLQIKQKPPDSSALQLAVSQPPQPTAVRRSSPALCSIALRLGGSYRSPLQVPREETVADIRERYLDINSHASSYNWMALRKNSHEQVCAA